MPILAKEKRNILVRKGIFVTSLALMLFLTTFAVLKWLELPH